MVKVEDTKFYEELYEALEKGKSMENELPMLQEVVEQNISADVIKTMLLRNYYFGRQSVDLIVKGIADGCIPSGIFRFMVEYFCVFSLNAQILIANAAVSGKIPIDDIISMFERGYHFVSNADNIFVRGIADGKISADLLKIIAKRRYVLPVEAMQTLYVMFVERGECPDIFKYMEDKGYVFIKRSRW